MYQMLREISSGRGEGPSYMKVPYIESSFQVTSIHHCTIFGIKEYLESEGECENAFICVCMSVCMCVLSKSSKTLYGTSEEKEMYGKFSFLVFRDFQMGTKFGRKIKSICCVKVVENGAKISGGIQKYILVVIFTIITNLCT